MDQRTLGQVLRLVGPLIQVLCLIVLMRPRGGQDDWLSASALRPWLYFGFGAGMVLVMLGLYLSRTARRGPTQVDDPRERPFRLDPHHTDPEDE